jgi:membrane-bound serine protease (ClpP class)
MIKLFFFFLLIVPLEIFPQNHISVLDIKGFINQATADYICQNLDQLNKRSVNIANFVSTTSNVDCILITLDSPGGCMDAINQISNSISKSDIPVITFLLPDNELNISNALLIPFASSLIVIPPGKSIKRSRDFDNFKFLIDSVKMDNNFSRFLTALNNTASINKRNFNFIKDAFRSKTILSSEAANTLKLVDYLASNQSDLMAKLNGKDINSCSSRKTLNTMPVSINQIDRDILLQALEILKNPAIGYILAILGLFNFVWGLFSSQKIYSISSATVLLCAAFYIFYSLPVSTTGISLIVASFVIFAIGTKIPSRGILQIIGVSVLFAGSLLLMDIYESFAVLYIPLYLIIGICVVTFLVFLSAKTFS